MNRNATQSVVVHSDQIASQIDDDRSDSVNDGTQPPQIAIAQRISGWSDLRHHVVVGHCVVLLLDKLSFVCGCVLCAVCCSSVVACNKTKANRCGWQCSSGVADIKEREYHSRYKF
jgi:hypothetical protein